MGARLLVATCDNCNAVKEVLEEDEDTAREALSKNEPYAACTNVVAEAEIVRCTGSLYLRGVVTLGSAV